MLADANIRIGNYTLFGKTLLKSVKDSILGKANEVGLTSELYSRGIKGYYSPDSGAKLNWDDYFSDGDIINERDFSTILGKVFSKYGYNLYVGTDVDIDGIFFCLPDAMLSVCDLFFAARYGNNESKKSIKISPRDQDDKNILRSMIGILGNGTHSKVIGLAEDFRSLLYSIMGSYAKNSIIHLYDNNGVPTLVKSSVDGVDQPCNDANIICSLTNSVIDKFGNNIKDVYFFSSTERFSYFIAKKYSNGELCILVF